MLLHVMGAMGSATGVVLLYGLLLALRPPSLLDAQYAVPILAMLLGHAISSVSLGLSTALEELSSGEVVLPLLWQLERLHACSYINFTPALIVLLGIYNV